MSAGLAGGDAALRRRALALMGVDVYELRPRSARATPAAPPNAVREPGPPVTARLALVAGRDAKGLLEQRLVRHVLLALGVDAGAVQVVAQAPATVPALCFGGAPGDAEAVLAPPLEALRVSPAAKRALWRDLRRFKPRLG